MRDSLEKRIETLENKTGVKKFKIKVVDNILHETIEYTCEGDSADILVELGDKVEAEKLEQTKTQG